MSHSSRLLVGFPAKSLLANHGSLGIIKNLLMMKIQSHGDFLAFSQRRRGAKRAWRALSGAARSGPLGSLVGPLLDHLVNYPPFDRILGGEEVVALQRILDLLERLAGVLHVDLIQPLLEVQDFLGVQHDVGRLSLEPA